MHWARRRRHNDQKRKKKIMIAITGRGLPRILRAALLAAGLLIGAGAVAQVPKLDAALNLFVQQPDVAMKAYGDRVQMPLRELEKAGAAPRLAVLIRLNDGANADAALASFRALGAVVGSKLGPIVTATVPVSSVKALSQLDAVMLIELARPAKSRLNASVPATHASALRSGSAPNWTGLTGKGVIVGIVDDGLDFRHGDFRKADGTTRLLGLWDQRAAGAAGKPPTGFTYGGECTTAMINAAINGDMAACTQPSAGAHGTHVGGIAAGNGQGTGNAQTAYRFVGMAPEADILSANSIAGGVSGNVVVDAIAWMKTKAAAAGKPLVINMSLGSYYGARDGTSNFEQALSNAGAVGVILTAAAGNEGSAAIRGEAPISQDGQVAFDLDIKAGQTSVTLEAWYPGTDAYSIVVKGPTCTATASIPATASDGIETPCGLIVVSNAGPFPTNDDRQLNIVFRSGGSTLAAGAWRVTFTGTTVAKANTPLSIVTSETGSDFTISAINGQPFTGITSQILTDTSSAKRVIGVASYNTNYAWTRQDGVASSGTPDHGAVNDLSSFSSRGPRRMCSNAAKCPPVMKPEITAPGAMIMSTKAGDKKVDRNDAEVVERDGVHIAFNGTSMATPHVAGAIALMLQKKPTLTPEDVRQLLFTNVQKTSFTPAVPTFAGTDVPAAPNYTWGYGVLDVKKAADAISTTTANVVTAFEFLYQPENRYFLTIDAAEANAIENGAAGPGWLRTGFTFKAYATTGDAPNGAVVVCRFYGSVSPGPNSHFFTASTAECQGLKDLQATTPITQKRWNYEGIAFRITEPDLAKNCASGLVPVYRAYNNGFTRGIDSNHRFSTSTAEIQKMVAQGWSNEGAVFCSPQ